MNSFWQLLLGSLEWLLLTSIYHHISFFSVYNVTLNVNKTLLQIDLLDPTSYRISMPASFLEDLTQTIFKDSLKQIQQLLSTIDKLLKFYTRFHVQERPIQLDKFVTYMLKNIWVILIDFNFFKILPLANVSLHFNGYILHLHFCQAVFWVIICTVLLTVCYYHVTYAFQSECTLYIRIYIQIPLL